MSTLFKNFAIYDWITLLYFIIGVVCSIWTSIGNNYVFDLIEKKIKKDSSLDKRIEKCDLYYIELRKSWLRNQNIWISITIN